MAERIGAPVVSFRTGRGIVDDRHPLGLTIAAGYRLWNQTDLLLAFGTRLEVPTLRWGASPPGLKIARIDIDPAEMRRLRVDVGIVADTADAARALAAVVAPREDSARTAAIAQAKADAAVDIRKVQPQMSFLEAIRDVLPEDGILCDEMTQVGYVSWFGFPFHRPRSLITSGFSGTLGAGFPMALGVKVAHPDRPVVAVTGDGGFMFGSSELATAVQHGINLVTVVFNNSSYGNVLRDQHRLYRRTRLRVAAAQSGLPDLCEELRRAVLACKRRRRALRGGGSGADSKFTDADRGDDRHHAGISAMGVHRAWAPIRAIVAGDTRGLSQRR